VNAFRFFFLSQLSMLIDRKHFDCKLELRAT